MRFKLVTFPKLGLVAQIPAHLALLEPAQSSLPIEQQHFLISIPWEDSYLANIPQDYMDFFLTVLPYLHVRTTDVHVAICLRHFARLVELFPPASFDPRLVIIAFILHDAGWSKLSEAEIAQSLGVTGLALSQLALGPKEKHAIEGEKIARQVLTEHQFSPPLTLAEINLICKAVRYHDQPEAVAGAGSAMPLEVRVLVDLDHLWSFTHENFWQDTVRKGVTPSIYLENLRTDLPAYFATEQGRSLALEFWEARAGEVSQLTNSAAAA